MNKFLLAIVIPAYKKEFLRETLQSINSQTRKDFTLYIGDDCSPYDLSKIVKEFDGKLSIIYKRFSENLGRSDLVAHWTRCMDMVRSEEWVWLFSDDDLMEPRCVECFYNECERNPLSELFHFNVQQINSNNEIIKSYPDFPERISSTDFFKMRIRYNIFSFVVEYIFKKELYLRNDGFQNFDLAWCADDATWIKFAEPNGIITIPKTGTVKVLWRLSGANISSEVSDKRILKRKVMAGLSYMSWLKENYNKKIFNHVSGFEKVKWVLMPMMISSSMGFSGKLGAAWSVARKLNLLLSFPVFIIYLCCHSLKKFLRFKS